MTDANESDPASLHAGLRSLCDRSPLYQEMIRHPSSRDWDLPGYLGAHSQKGTTYFLVRKAARELVALQAEQAWSAESLLTAAVAKAGGDERDTLDPVIIYTIACQDGVQAVMRAWEDQAVAAYLGWRGFYDWLLIKLLPDRLCRARTWAKACEAYSEGTHATAAADWEVYRAVLAQRPRRPLRGMPTGLPVLDRALLGLSGLTLLGGRPGTGKTALALQLLASALRNDPQLAVLFLLLDPGMSRTVVYDRLMCAGAAVPYRRLLEAHSESVRRCLDAAGEELSQKVLPRLKVVQRPQVAPDQDPVAVDEEFIEEHRDALLRSTGASRILVVVDYLGLIDVPQKMKPMSLDADAHRVNVIQEVRRRSRVTMNDTGDTYLVIAEVAKGSGEGMTGNDLLGSTRLQYSADAILLLELDAPGGSTAAEEVGVKLRIAKGRDGTERTTIPLRFHHALATFREPSQAAPGGEPPAKHAPDGPRGLNALAGIDEE